MNQYGSVAVLWQYNYNFTLEDCSIFNNTAITVQKPKNLLKIQLIKKKKTGGAFYFYIYNDLLTFKNSNFTQNIAQVK